MKSLGEALQMQSWQAHERAVVSLAFAPAGNILATAAEDEPGVRIWDLTSGAAQRELALFKETATCLTFSPDGKMLAAGRPWSVELWDPATGNQRLILEGHRHFSRSLAFAPDGAGLLSAGMRLGGRWLGAPQAIIWDLTDGRVTAEFVGPPSDMPSLIWALDSKTVAWVRPGVGEKAPPVVTITDVPTGKPRILFDSPGPFRQPALSSDEKTLAGAVRGDVVIWSIADLPMATAPATGWRRWLGRPNKSVVPPLMPRAKLSAGAERIDTVAFTPDGRRLLAGSASGRVREWDVPDLMVRDAPPSQEPASRTIYEWGIGPVTELAVAADGLTAAGGGATGGVVVWDVEV